MEVIPNGNASESVSEDLHDKGWFSEITLEVATHKHLIANEVGILTIIRLVLCLVQEVCEVVPS
jgi:hypothetical protein